MAPAAEWLEYCAGCGKKHAAKQWAFLYSVHDPVAEPNDELIWSLSGCRTSQKSKLVPNDTHHCVTKHVDHTKLAVDPLTQRPAAVQRVCHKMYQVRAPYLLCCSV
jgi:hypothetical protein